MTVSNQPWRHPKHEASDLSLIVVPAPVLHSLAQNEVLPEGISLTPYLVGDECIGLWRMRSLQVRNTASDIPWITRFVCITGIAVPIGLAGFHGVPDADGMVEVGYRIDPNYRRRGYARRALEILLSVAQAQSEVRTVRATISPENTASRTLIEDYGFQAVGEQWDEEDGLEIIFEAAA
ncbi:GNAT family N-acetyltransferase [Arthrobacter flavus]|uniref:GNAT family N-acetyltransferase n=1 Tax=Arthrobacter flavus TaxID=95172 RepID=A0ABW4Q9U1_9MICC